MENKITNELIEQAKKAESVEALLALAKENGISMTEETAEKLFTEWHTTKELSDEELDSVSGGCGEEPETMPSFEQLFCGLERVFCCPNGCNTGRYNYETPCPSCGTPCTEYCYLGEAKEKDDNKRIYG